MQDYQLVITPLSPIHLGTGEDFLPTNYVIDNGVLYEFDPASAKLFGEQKQQLKTICNSPNLHKIYDFIKENKDIFRECAYHKVGISSLSSGKEIARCATNPVTNLPVILGSALKGCVRTAVLNHLIQDKKYTDDKKMQTELLGSFDNDMFSQFKPSDLEAVDKSIRSYICKVNKHYKKTGLVKGMISNYVETIAPAQYRAFSGSLNIFPKSIVKQLPNNKKIDDIEYLIEILNKYHKSIFNNELKIGLIDNKWVLEVKKLLENLNNNKRIALIRLGKLCGAESKTLPQVAQIKVHGIPEKETTMLSLTEDKLPMGWALLEVKKEEESWQENTELKNWCNENNHIVQKINQAIEKAEKEDKELKETLAKQQEKEQQRKEKEAAEKAEKERMAQEKALAEEQRRASLSDFERALENIEKELTKLASLIARQTVEIEQIYNKFKQFLETAIDKYSADERKQIAEQFNRRKLAKQYPKLVSGNRLNELKSLLDKLRGE